jgi:hypothetical protein
LCHTRVWIGFGSFRSFRSGVGTHDNTNRGALFKSTRKETDTNFDYRGEIDVDGHSYWLNAWLKTSRAGEKYMSLSVKPKPAKYDTSPQRTYAQRRDDIAF